MLKLWGRANSLNVQKVVFCLEELGLAYERSDAGLEFGVVNTPQYRAMNPNGLVPTLDDDGLVLWESNAIVRYLCARYGAEAFWPMDPATRAKADRWMDWQQTTLNQGVGTCFRGLVRFPGSVSADELDHGRKQAEAAFAILEGALATQPFLSGETIGMADFVVGPVVYRWLRLPVERVPRPAVEAYGQRLDALASAQKGLVAP